MLSPYRRQRRKKQPPATLREQAPAIALVVGFVVLLIAYAYLTPRPAPAPRHPSPAQSR